MILSIGLLAAFFVALLVTGLELDKAIEDKFLGLGLRDFFCREYERVRGACGAWSMTWISVATLLANFLPLATSVVLSSLDASLPGSNMLRAVITTGLALVTGVGVLAVGKRSLLYPTRDAEKERQQTRINALSRGRAKSNEATRVTVHGVLSTLHLATGVGALYRSYYERVFTAWFDERHEHVVVGFTRMIRDRFPEDVILDVFNTWDMRKKVKPRQFHKVEQTRIAEVVKVMLGAYRRRAAHLLALLENAQKRGGPRGKLRYLINERGSLQVEGERYAARIVSESASGVGVFVGARPKEGSNVIVHWNRHGSIAGQVRRLEGTANGDAYLGIRLSEEVQEHLLTFGRSCGGSDAEGEQGREQSEGIVTEG